MPRITIGRITKGGSYECLAPSSDADREKFNEMLACQQAPRCNTDSTFMADCRAGHDDGLVGESAMKFRQMYQNATGSRPDGKFYCSQLADFPGDPKAWVGSKSDVKRRCKEKGVGFVGSVNVEAPEVEPKPEPKEYTVAPDIVHKRLAAMEREQPGSVTSLSKREMRDLKEKVTRVASGRA